MAKSTRISDLFRLVANDAVDPHKAVEKSYEWEHSRALEVGKWSLAGATALIAAVATGFIRQTDSSSAANTLTSSNPIPHNLMGIWTFASLGAAGLLLVVGVSSLLLASQIERRFVLTLALVAKMVELRSFLKKVVDDGGKNN